MNNINKVELKINGETKYNSETDKNPGFQLNSVSANNNNNNNLDENGVDISKYTKVIQPDYRGKTNYWYNKNGTMKEVTVELKDGRYPESGFYEISYIEKNMYMDTIYDGAPPLYNKISTSGGKRRTKRRRTKTRKSKRKSHKK
jgi:hypothetical protein